MYDETLVVECLLKEAILPLEDLGMYGEIHDAVVNALKELGMSPGSKWNHSIRQALRCYNVDDNGPTGLRHMAMAYLMAAAETSKEWDDANEFFGADDARKEVVLAIGCLMAHMDPEPTLVGNFRCCLDHPYTYAVGKARK